MECDSSTVPPVELIEGCRGTFHQQVRLVYAHVCVCQCVCCVSRFDGRRESQFYKRTKKRTDTSSVMEFFGYKRVIDQ